MWTTHGTHLNESCHTYELSMLYMLHTQFWKGIIRVQNTLQRTLQHTLQHALQHTLQHTRAIHVTSTVLNRLSARHSLFRTVDVTWMNHSKAHLWKVHLWMNHSKVCLALSQRHTFVCLCLWHLWILHSFECVISHITTHMWTDHVIPVTYTVLKRRFRAHIWMCHVTHKYAHMNWLWYTCCIHSSEKEILWLVSSDLAHTHLEGVIWCGHTHDMTHAYVWSDAFMCVTWLIHMCDMTHSYVWHVSFICVTWLIHMCDMSPSYVWHDSCICVASQQLVLTW